MSDRVTWDALWEHGGREAEDRLREEVGREEASFRCGHILRYVEEQGLVLQQMSVIEVGSGSGIYSTILAKRGAAATALDQSGVALKRVRERAKAVGVDVSELFGDALAVAKERGGQFDMAMSFGTVEHFHPPLRYEMCRAHWEMVRPGGIVVISVPNILFLPHEFLKLALIARGKWYLGYEGSFTPWELRMVGQRLGLERIEMSGTDAWRDALRYWALIRGTGLWRRVFPAWTASGITPDNVGEKKKEEYGRLRWNLNRFLGHDITLIGIKGHP